MIKNSYFEFVFVVFPKLTYTEVQQKLKSSPKTVILDVREKAELTSDGRIDGAVNVPRMILFSFMY